MAGVFRDRAIAAQSSSEALDQRVHVVPLRAWLALGLAVLVLATGAMWLFGGNVAVTVEGSGTIVNAPTNIAVSAPVDGTVVGDTLDIGTHLAKGDPMLFIESGTNRTRVPVTAPVDGTVVALGAGQGAAVMVGDNLATVAPDSDEQVGYLYVAESAGNQVSPGMVVRLLPNDVDATRNGYLKGTVATVSPLPVTRTRLDYVLADQPMADHLAASGPLLEVLVALDVDTTTPTGYVWTQPPGPDAPIVSGIPTAGSIIVAEVPPFRAFFSG